MKRTAKKKGMTLVEVIIANGTCQVCQAMLVTAAVAAKNRI